MRILNVLGLFIVVGLGILATTSSEKVDVNGDELEKLQDEEDEILILEREKRHAEPRRGGGYRGGSRRYRSSSSRRRGGGIFHNGDYMKKQTSQLIFVIFVFTFGTIYNLV